MNMYSSIGVMVSLVGVMIGLNLDSAAAAIIALLIAVYTSDRIGVEEWSYRAAIAALLVIVIFLLRNKIFHPVTKSIVVFRELQFFKALLDSKFKAAQKMSNHSPIYRRLLYAISLYLEHQ